MKTKVRIIKGPPKGCQYEKKISYVYFLNGREGRQFFSKGMMRLAWTRLKCKAHNGSYLQLTPRPEDAGPVALISFAFCLPLC